MKINSKAFTVIELVLSFAFVSILSATLFAAVTNYRDKELKVVGLKEVKEYRDKITIEIQNDISLKLLKNIEYCDSTYGEVGTTVLRLCLNFNFLDDTSKSLKVITEQTDAEEVIAGQKFQYKDKREYISYGDIRYEIPDSQNIYIDSGFMFKSTELKDDIENNIAIYNVTIPIKHKNLNGNFDISITAAGKKSITNAPGSYNSYNAGDVVKVQITPREQMNFYVLKPSNAYSSKITLLSFENLSTSKYYLDSSSGNSYEGSLVQKYISYKYDEWITADEVRLPYAEEIGFLVGACPKYMIEGEEGIVDISSVSEWISKENGLSNSYWTETSKKGDDNKVWVVDGITKTMSAKKVTDEYGIRPVVIIDKAYIIGKESGVYTIVLNANGADNRDITPPSVTCVYGQNCILPTNPYVKDGFTFKGWSTAIDSTLVQYTNGQTVNSIALNGTVTLYAVWEKN